MTDSRTSKNWLREDFSNNVLILGCSYGALLAAKLIMSGHNVTLVGVPGECNAINQFGSIVHIGARVGQEHFVINSSEQPGELKACTAYEVDPRDFDLVVFSIQEPFYSEVELSGLVARIGAACVPCVSIMNMPPVTFLRRVSGIDVDTLDDCYRDMSVWRLLDPKLFTHSSPDPQALRPDPDRPNFLQVGLPTNFRVAPFDQDIHNSLLRRLQRDIDDVRYEGREVPVKLRMHESLFVPLSKWPMIVCGNYRCITEGGPRSIRDAVHGNPEESRDIYDTVSEVILNLGASEREIVPFEKYANAALSLIRPSSAARAIYSGARYIERPDKLVRNIAASHGIKFRPIDEIVSLVDSHLEANNSH